MCLSSGTAELLMTERPRLPCNKSKPPEALNGLDALRKIVSSGLSAGSSTQFKLLPSVVGFLQ